MPMSAGAAAATAAVYQAKLREEEEYLTTYTGQDLDGWEFKIVRSAGKISGDKFRQLCAEERQNGWELVEKFDDYRVRFKRRVEERERDGYSEIEPYRTQYGLTEAKLVFIILGAVFAVIAIILALVLGLNG